MIKQVSLLRFMFKYIERALQQQYSFSPHLNIWRSTVKCPGSFCQRCICRKPTTVSYNQAALEPNEYFKRPYCLFLCYLCTILVGSIQSQINLDRVILTATSRLSRLLKKRGVLYLFLTISVENLCCHAKNINLACNLIVVWWKR